MTDDDLTRAVTTGLLGTFHMARAAARQMTKQGSGAILTLTSGTSFAPTPGMGSFDVLRIEGGAIAEITTFDATLFPAFGLPPVYPSDARQRP